MSEPRWLSEREQAAWRGFMSMHAVINAELARRLTSSSPLSYQDYEVLVALTDHPEGELRVLELADVLGWEKSRLSHQVSRMAARDLVAKRPCFTDGRGLIVSVTEHGRDRIRAAAPAHVESVRELFIDKLSPQQLDQLAHMAEDVLAEDAVPTAPVNNND